MPVGYAIASFTAYTRSNPLPNRIDNAFTQIGTCYLRIYKAETSTFAGSLGVVAVSAIADDLSFTASRTALSSDDSPSIDIPNDASNFGGVNGSKYHARPGVIIRPLEVVSFKPAHQTVDLQIADTDIHSGVPHVDLPSLIIDCFVVQSGYPWGFNPGDAVELSPTRGVNKFQQPVSEPTEIALFTSRLCLVAAARRCRSARCPTA